MKTKNTLFLTLVISALIVLFVFSINISNSISETLDLYMYRVFPSLFLFVLFTNIVINTGAIYILSNFFFYISYPFKLSKKAAPVILLGYLCGFPSASSIIDKMYKENELSKEEAYHLMAFTNNASPIFIYSAVSISMLSDSLIGIKLLFIHIFASILIGIGYMLFHKDNTIIQENHNNLKINIEKKYIGRNKFDIFKSSIIDSFKTMLFILGYMIIFNIFADILNSYNLPFITEITSCFELSKGIYTSVKLGNLPFISFLLGFSSLSVIFQIKGSLKHLDYSVFKIIKFKFLHGIISYILALFIFLNI